MKLLSFMFDVMSDPHPVAEKAAFGVMLVLVLVPLWVLIMPETPLLLWVVWCSAVFCSPIISRAWWCLSVTPEGTLIRDSSDTWFHFFFELLALSSMMLAYAWSWLLILTGGSYYIATVLCVTHIVLWTLFARSVFQKRKAVKRTFAILRKAGLSADIEDVHLRHYPHLGMFFPYPLK